MGKKYYNDKTYKEKIYNKYDNNFTILNTYNNMTDDMHIKCNHCGNELTLKANTLLHKKNAIWCIRCCKLDQIEKQIKIIKSQYPFQYSEDLILYLDDVYYTNGRKHYKVDIHDNEGYKYNYESGYIVSAKTNGYELSRFFQRNPFTSDNIQNFLNINDIPLKLLTGDLYSGGARDKLEFLDKSDVVQHISWNDIQSSTYRYKDDYYDTLQYNQYVKTIDKKQATEIIYRMQSKLDRPICQDDFKHPTKETIGIKIVERIWGNLTAMQQDLGLTIGIYAKKVPSDVYLDYIKDVCQKVYQNEHRTLLVVNDFKKYGVAWSKTYESRCRENGTTLREVLKSLGFELQKSGSGFNYTFDDGERVVSMYEYKFSNFLRQNNLIYNRDYFRSIKYKTLTTIYKGNMNCDYEIHINGRIFYVELAGILGNKEHQECYRNNIPIKSKSKEKYRLGLMSKKEIFEKENLEYYILLPDDMNENTYKLILNNDY